MPPKFYILSADDDRDDQDLIEEALRQGHIQCQLQSVGDGDQLLSRLRFLNQNNQPLPALILLDLNMPVRGGKETLQLLKSEEKTIRDIPVYILTTSDSAHDIEFCLKNGAERYLVKPTTFNELTVMLKDAIGDLCATAERQH
jgi:CheY-like chemotaxis protein